MKREHGVCNFHCLKRIAKADSLAKPGVARIRNVFSAGHYTKFRRKNNGS